MVGDIEKRKGLNPPFEVSDHFVVHDSIGRDLLGYYEYFPCKILSCCLCYIVRGSLKVKINIGEYDINANDFVVLIPGSFLQIKEVSDDVIISFEGYSSSLLKKMNFWKILAPILQYIVAKPVFSLNEQMSNFYKESFSIMSKASQFGSSFMTNSIAQSSFVVAIDMLANAIKSDMVKVKTEKHSSRDLAIVGNFIHDAFENYTEEHKISYYAKEASLTLSHFCNVVSRTTGLTPQRIIMNLIIMDAKNQLSSSDLPVSKIASSLGFSSATTFNRYFKTYTSMTPQEFRNKKDD